MEPTPERHRRVVVLVAVALVAHLWMLQAGAAHGAAASPVDLLPSVVSTVGTTHHLPATPHCSTGMAACLVTDPEDRPAAAALAMLVAAAGLLWTLAPRPHDLAGLRRPRARRDARRVPRPAVPASVVLRQ